MPAAILALIPFIQAAIKAAPSIIETVKGIKDFIVSLVKQGVIPASYQDQLHAYVDDVAAKVDAGQEPPEFTVEPDPTSA